MASSLEDEKDCDERENVCLVVCVCSCVCLLTYLQKTYSGTSPNFVCMLTIVVARYHSDGVAIHYVIPVLQMTLCFHTTGLIDSNQILLNAKDQQVDIVGCAPLRSLLSKTLQHESHQ